MNRWKVIILGIGVLLISANSDAATITVAQDGSGVVKSVQAAFAAATNGDEIVILDDGVYEEDVMTGAGFQMVASYTLKAAEGKKPIIRAANKLPRLITLGIVGVDYMGFALLGCQNVSIEGITFENLSFDYNGAKYGAALTIADSVGVSIKNCTFRGAGAEEDKYNDGLNSTIFVAGLGVIAAPTNIAIDSCLFENFLKGITIAEWPNPAALADPSVIVRDSTFKNGVWGIEITASSYPESPNPATILAGSGIVIKGNEFLTLSGVGIALSGCYASIDHNMFLQCYAGIDAHYIPELSLAPTTAKIDQCAFIGMETDGMYVHMYNTETNADDHPVAVDVANCAFIGNQDFGVYVERGKTSFRNCTFAGNGLSAARISNGTGSVTSQFYQCDFYKNNQIDYPEYPHFKDHFEFLVDYNNYPTRVEITNCNIVGERGVLNGYLLDHSIFDPAACVVSYSNVYTQSDPLVNVVSDHILNIDPQYVSPTVDPSQYDPDDFQIPSDSILQTAGKGGEHIGAWGATPSAVAPWDLYR